MDVECRGKESEIRRPSDNSSVQMQWLTDIQRCRCVVSLGVLVYRYVGILPQRYIVVQVCRYKAIELYSCIDIQEYKHVVMSIWVYTCIRHVDMQVIERYISRQICRCGLKGPCTCVRVYGCVCVCLCGWVCLRACMFAYVSVHVCIYACMCVYMYVCQYEFMFVCMNICKRNVT